MPETLYPDDFSEYLIGENYPLLKADSSASNSAAALRLISQARRTIDIFTHNLDPRILDTPEISSAVSDFVKISANSRLRILICDPSMIVKRGHRVIELSRKYSSYITFRKTNDEFLETPYSFLTVDSTGLLYRPHDYEYNAIVDFNAKKACQQHHEFFTDVWELSEPVSELRQLYL